MIPHLLLETFMGQNIPETHAKIPWAPNPSCSIQSEDACAFVKESKSDCRWREVKNK